MNLFYKVNSQKVAGVWNDSKTFTSFSVGEQIVKKQNRME